MEMRDSSTKKECFEVNRWMMNFETMKQHNDNQDNGNNENFNNYALSVTEKNSTNRVIRNLGKKC